MMLWWVLWQLWWNADRYIEMEIIGLDLNLQLYRLLEILECFSARSWAWPHRVSLVEGWWFYWPDESESKVTALSAPVTLKQGADACYNVPSRFRYLFWHTRVLTWSHGKTLFPTFSMYLAKGNVRLSDFIISDPLLKSNIWCLKEIYQVGYDTYYQKVVFYVISNLWPINIRK